MLNKNIKIAIAGLGNVGSELFKIINQYNKNNHHKILISALSSRSKKDFITDDIRFYNNPLDLAKQEDIDIIIELIGGDDIAKNLAIAALANKKHYITANKALLANYGEELAKIANRENLLIAFEAAVGGSIPIIRAINDSFSGDNITELFAILNGTCNFILTKMQNDSLDFVDALKKAQDLGFAESDPTFDIDGIDTAHKITLISALISGGSPNFTATNCQGISKININHIKSANNLGYKIKLIGYFVKENNNIIQAVFPALINDRQIIANIDHNFNAILLNGKNSGWQLLAGAGAGGIPTASAVLSDIINIANNIDSINNKIAINKLIRNEDQLPYLDISVKYFRFFISCQINKKELELLNSNNSDGIIKNIFNGNIIVLNADFIDDNDEISASFIVDKTTLTELNNEIASFNHKLLSNINIFRIIDSEAFTLKLD
jgi:homoserine dehydrogenase